MKKILYFIFVFAFLGCNKSAFKKLESNHFKEGSSIIVKDSMVSLNYRVKDIPGTYTTVYWGDINSDTLPSLQDEYGERYYVIQVLEFSKEASKAMDVGEMYMTICINKTKSKGFTMLFDDLGGIGEKEYFNPNDTDLFN